MIAANIARSLGAALGRQVVVVTVVAPTRRCSAARSRSAVCTIDDDDTIRAPALRTRRRRLICRRPGWASLSGDP
jgi:hypothetical protein